MKHKLRTLLFVLSFTLLLVQLPSQPVRAINEFDCTVVTEISQDECLALVAFYDSTNGAGWTNHTNWLETLTPSDWFGVTVDAGFVTQVILVDNGLSGAIPSEIGDLAGLLYLDLNNNLISGALPPELFNLSNLVYLDLSSNLLSGSMPPGLGNPSALEYLYLDHNQLTGEIPIALGNFSSLSHLDLGFNQLTGTIPLELENLSLLSHLYLNNNQLSGEIPSGLGNLTLLERLYLYDNMLSGSIPPALGGLTHMWSLWLSGNQLTGPIPAELGQLSSMEWLRLADNQLSGTIPQALGALTNLRQLSLANNQLSGDIPAALGDMTSLEVLSLAHNQLTGSIPVQLSYLANLFELDLSSNQLSGSIPPALGNLTYLYMLLLDDNQLSGDVPDITSLIYLLPPGDPDGDGLNLDYNALTVPLGYPDPLSELQAFLNQYDPNWHTLQAFDQVIGAEGGVVMALDGSTSFDIPAGALSEFATFTFTPFPTPRYAPGALIDAHHSFRLTAEDLFGVPVTTFYLPLTVTLTYTDTDVLDFPEASLALYYWDSGTLTWLDAVTTCESSAYTRDPVANSLTLPLCHLSDFSLFGRTLQPTFLPLVVRRTGGTAIR